MRCVLAHDFTVAKVALWRSSMDDRPPYQRQSAAWSVGKQQLFIDSLLNGYDVPKVYLRDVRGQHPTKVYTVVDGKQRLTAIWQFLRDEFPLAADFRIEPANVPELPPGAVPPAGGSRFSEFDPVWREVLKTTFLSVVLIQDATEEDIEELFFRLNNGEPLNAAEKRNAIGGDMAQLIREVAGRPFFTRRLPFDNTRYRHLDLAARLLWIEHAQHDPTAKGGSPPDLRSGALDEFVAAHRRLSPADRAALLAATDRQLARLSAVFTPADPLLANQTDVLVHALFLRRVRGDLPDGPSPARLRDVLVGFHAARRAALDAPPGRQDAALVEFTRLVQRGAGDRGSLERCLQILTDQLLRRYPDAAQHQDQRLLPADRTAPRSAP